MSVKTDKQSVEAQAADLRIEGIKYAAGMLLALLKEKEDAEKERDSKQAKIDDLMFEYCPDEMMEEQIEEWGRNQVRCSPEEEAAINKSLGIEKK